MKRFRVVIGALALLTMGTCVRSQDLKQKYVGKSGCTEGIRGRQYGARLDKTQNTYLEARVLPTVKVLLIIQFQDASDRCGLIRDIVENHRIAADFEFACVDNHRPSEIVIGTRDSDDEKITGPAIQAWLIDLKNQSFVLTRDRVTCSRENDAGSDDGSDLVDAAKKHATHQKL